MIVRSAIVAAAMLAAGPALAQPMNPDMARRFVAGKLFSFNCFDGSRGAGRIYGDGSVIGTVQFGGSGPMRSVWLPAGTLHARGELICASIKGMSFEPCFNLNRTSEHSFRGSISGFGIAYCDFTRRMSVAGMGPRRHLSEPRALGTAEAVPRSVQP
ncbi:MAG TPA: hypothetical protein VGF60_17275 [Xanthobacteraceae bacterium]|jgi:hypothetical protein